MPHHHVRLESEVFTSYRCQRAANALDINTKEKSIHELSVDVPANDEDFNVGLIVGASGSGKTTLAKQVYGDGCFRELLDLSRPIVDQFPETFSYDDCVAALNGVGLTQVPCWIRPAHTLSNGQRARAEAALQLAQVDQGGVVVLDEWTSVVDRTVAKVMSACLAKVARKQKRRIVVLSCHYDVIEWLDPDWIVDCNTAQLIDRRLLQPGQGDRRRTDRITFDVAEVDRSSWRYFEKYHYLSRRMPGGKVMTFGLFHDADQIGFQCYANYVPRRKGDRMKMHSNRVVIHPDYAGLGLGIRLVNTTAEYMASLGYVVMAKFSSEPMYRARQGDPRWRLMDVKRQLGATVVGGNMVRDGGFRENVKTYSFVYVGQAGQYAGAR